ncbi:MAG: FtsW/RodA/SpoVE family cell cycle protein [Bacilli bacterium]|nr:FtsW/RodA/SpoVE family cell cycle protein [Bacilli bacterium]
MKKIMKNLDKPLLFLSIILFTYGLIMIFSASNITSFMKYKASPYNYFFRQGLFLFGSTMLSFIIIKFSSKSYKYLTWFMVVGIIVLLTFLFLYGSAKNMAVSWIDLGFFSLQPSEFSKLIIIVWLSTYYEHNIKKLDQYKVVLFPIFMSMIIAGLIFLQPDLGTTIIFSSIVGFIFLITPIGKEIKKNIFILFLGMALVGVLVVLATGGSIFKSHQFERFDYFNPCSEEKFYDDGNQVCNGFIAMNNGGLTGVGLGNSTQKYLYLPEAHTDFIFCIVMEETGLIGALSIITMFFLLLGRIIKIGRESHNDRGTLICYGIAIYIFLHIVVNLGGIMGIIPMTGVPLPFFSYGGSFTLTLVFALTVVQRINVENKMYKEYKEKTSKK